MSGTWEGIFEQHKAEKTDPLDQIPSRIKYYLLEYKDKNMEDFQSQYPEKRLRDLSFKQLREMFEMAIKKDIEKLKVLG
tara:strand:- start:18153 stop:18389 length:237 start_codon:yes stop_codon:yes gene_type:complete